MSDSAPRPAAESSGTELRVRYAGIGDEAGASLATQLAAIEQLNWTSIELRTLDGVPVAAVSDDEFERVAATIAARGLAVTCLASGIGNWSRPVTADFAPDVAELDVLARRCHRLGARYIRVMSYTAGGLDEREWGRRARWRLGELAERAEQAGVTLVHENCSGWAACHAERMLELAAQHPGLALLFDIGNGVAYGYRALTVLAEIVDHVAHVHVKDARGDKAEPVYTPAGAGEAEVAQCLRLLLDHGFSGTWSIEPHIAVRPHEGLAADTAHRGAHAPHEGFVACGRALERLVVEDVLPTLPGWSAVPGGLRGAGAR
ncbi:sugar phosphate isomerase/epimerase family protein [Salinactinospora qingdaonensis]|uniref:Xylose isomerase-like TIM barrel domain-containing protein n=1 Tax=Salinactinospora qingdaonensis TaxID=702744 RepID=A0ABP7GFR5_9ACTN